MPDDYFLMLFISLWGAMMLCAFYLQATDRRSFPVVCLLPSLVIVMGHGLGFELTGASVAAGLLLVSALSMWSTWSYFSALHRRPALVFLAAAVSICTIASTGWGATVLPKVAWTVISLIVLLFYYLVARAIGPKSRACGD